MKKLRLMQHTLLPLLTALLMIHPATAAIVYDEAIDGDLPDDPSGTTPPGPLAIPALIPVSLGDNIVRLTTGPFNPDVSTSDLFTFDVPSGLFLESVVLVDYIPGPFNNNQTSGFASWAIDGETVLAPMGLSVPSIGQDLFSPFDVPFNPSAGDFFRVSEFQGLATTELNFVFSTVPIPPAVWLFGSGLLSLVGIARRKS